MGARSLHDLPLKQREATMGARSLHDLPLKLKEATMGFEPMIRVLQTLALPLGHVALREVFYQRAGGRSSKYQKYQFFRS